MGGGDIVAALYVAHADKLRRLLRSPSPYSGRPRPAVGSTVAGGTQGIDAEDLVQEVFARLLASQAYARIDAHRDPVPYLLASARNLQTDLLRRWRRMTSACSLPADDDGATGALLLEAVAAFVVTLPAPLRGLYDARFVRGLSQRDAAVALGLTRRKVRTMERHLLAAVAGALSDRDEDATAPTATRTDD